MFGLARSSDCWSRPRGKRFTRWQLSRRGCSWHIPVMYRPGRGWEGQCLGARCHHLKDRGSSPTGKQRVRDDAINSGATLVSEHGRCCGAGRTEGDAAHQIVAPHRPMQRPCAGVGSTCADAPRAMAGKCASRERTSRQASVVSANNASSTTSIWRGSLESRFLICPGACAKWNVPANTPAQPISSGSN